MKHYNLWKAGSDSTPELCNGIILALVAGLGAVSAIVTIVVARSSLPERRSLRWLVVLALAVVGVGVTIAAFQRDETTPGTQPRMPAEMPANTPAKTPTDAEHRPAVEQQPRETAAASVMTPAASAPPRIRIVSDPGVEPGDLISIAQQAVCSRCGVEGTLSVATKVEHELQDLVTADMRLHVTITHPDGQSTALTLTSRGGGFTKDAAIDQARERIGAEFKQRLAAVR